MCECIFLNCPAGSECEREKLLAKKIFADPNIPLESFETFKPKKNVQFSDQNTSTDEDTTTVLIHQSKGFENV